MSDEPVNPDSEVKREDFLARIIDQLLDLLETARDWVQQEAEATVRTKIVPPLQQVGITIGAAIGAASFLAMGAVFIAVAGIVYLSQLLGVPLAFLLIGSVYLLGAAVFTIVKVRTMQR